jgi:hypothetical protein
MRRVLPAALAVMLEVVFRPKSSVTPAGAAVAAVPENTEAVVAPAKVLVSSETGAAVTKPSTGS